MPNALFRTFPTNSHSFGAALIRVLCKELKRTHDPKIAPARNALAKSPTLFLASPAKKVEMQIISLVFQATCITPGGTKPKSSQTQLPGQNLRKCPFRYFGSSTNLTQSFSTSGTNSENSSLASQGT